MKFHSKILISNILYTLLSTPPERVQQPFWGLISLLSFCQPYSFSTDSKISVTVCSVTKLICSHSGSNQLLTGVGGLGGMHVTKQKTDKVKITSSPYLEPEPRLIGHISNKSSRLLMIPLNTNKKATHTHTSQRETQWSQSVTRPGWHRYITPWHVYF